MEKHIENIELINKYLNKTLSEIETQSFENQLKTDPSLEILYEEHVIFLEGLKRQQLKTDIIKAKQSYIQNKWFRYLGIASLIIILTVVAFIFINSNNPEIDSNSSSEVNNSIMVLDTISSKESMEEPVFKDTLKTEKAKAKVEIIKKKITKKEKLVETKLSQKFTLNSQKDTTLICKEGTKLIVKANSFVNANNNLVKGSIDIVITEYYKLSDMLLANLTTTSNGKQLETGGMLFIKAKKGVDDLKLKENSNIELLFPTDNEKEGMQLFSGEWKEGIINWNLENQIIEDSIVEFREPVDDVEVPFSIVDEVPIYPGCENGNNAQQKKCMSEAIQQFVQRNFNMDLAEEIGLYGRQRINSNFKINKNGAIIAIQSRASHPLLEEEANRVISLLPKMLPGKHRRKVVTVPYSLPIIFQVEGEFKMFTSGRNSLPKGRITDEIDSIVVEKLESAIIQEESGNLSAEVIKSYMLLTSKLGWINCDRFINRNNSIKYKLKIKNEDGAKVNMVFKSLKSILSSRNIMGNYDFGTVPIKEDVTLVAIKKNKGKLYLDVINTTTEENPNIEFNFKEVTIQELKTELKKLDTLF